MLEVTLRWIRIPSTRGDRGGARGVEILLVSLCYRNRDTLRPDKSLSSYAGLTNIMGGRVEGEKVNVGNNNPILSSVIRPLCIVTSGRPESELTP